LLRPSDHDQPLPDAVSVQVSAFHNGVSKESICKF